MFSYVNADTTLQRLSTISHLVSDLFALYTFILNKSSDLSFTRSFTRLLATCCHSVGVLLFFRNFCSALHKELVLCSKKQYRLIKLSIYVANKLNARFNVLDILKIRTSSSKMPAISDSVPMQNMQL